MVRYDGHLLNCLFLEREAQHCVVNSFNIRLVSPHQHWLRGNSHVSTVNFLACVMTLMGDKVHMHTCYIELHTQQAKAITSKQAHSYVSCKKTTSKHMFSCI